MGAVQDRTRDGNGRLNDPRQGACPALKRPHTLPVPPSLMPNFAQGGSGHLTRDGAFYGRVSIV
jgi:hypothetical protein